MSKKSFVSAVTILAIGITVSIRAQQKKPTDTPMSQHSMEEMNKRGDKAMGFDHLKTTHHFLLANEGGSIGVTANDPKDKESRDQIRKHLRHIAMMFSDGNFAVPMLIHEEKPPGSQVMEKLKDQIKYEFEEADRGALIRISTSNSEALTAIHEFLRYQIKEHMTNDPLEVPAKP